jgi:hypothetical protein
MAFYLALETFFRKVFGFVQPGCTIESFSIFVHHPGEFDCFTPPDLPQIVFRYARQLFVDRHKVVGLAARVRKMSFQEFIK